MDKKEDTSSELSSLLSFKQNTFFHFLALMYIRPWRDSFIYILPPEFIMDSDVIILTILIFNLGRFRHESYTFYVYFRADMSPFCWIYVFSFCHFSPSVAQKWSNVWCQWMSSLYTISRELRNYISNSLLTHMTYTTSSSCRSTLGREACFDIGSLSYTYIYIYIYIERNVLTSTLVI